MSETHKKLVEAAKTVLRLLDHVPGVARNHWMVQRLRDAVRESEAG